MDTHHPDILIHGAGPAGCALALLLARQTRAPQRIGLVLPSAPPRPDVTSAHHAPAPHQDTPATPVTDPAAEPTSQQAFACADMPPDPRALALNHGSRVLLEELGAWPAHSADILTVHVSQRHRLGRTLISHHELDAPRLGSVVGYDALLGVLRQAVRHQGITLLQDSPATGPDCVPARLTVHSDGRRPQGLQRQYGQHALLSTVRAAQPAPGWAFERFTDYGPLALLPHPQGHDLYSLVWCATPQRAAALQSLSTKAFDQALRDAFGDRLGALHGLGTRAIFPLLLDAGPQRLGVRGIAIGNAAQTLHPVAGQGMNLALRDAVQLMHALQPWLRNPALDPAAMLDDFIDRRRADRWLTIGITDLLPRVFSTRTALAEHACGAGLLTLDLCRPARTTLARQLLLGTRS